MSGSHKVGIHPHDPGCASFDVASHSPLNWGRMRSLFRTGVGTTQHMAPESTRNSLVSVASGFAGFPTCTFTTVSPRLSSLQVLLLEGTTPLISPVGEPRL